jgi:hypothetical protein
MFKTVFRATDGSPAPTMRFLLVVPSAASEVKQSADGRQLATTA